MEGRATALEYSSSNASSFRARMLTCCYTSFSLAFMSASRTWAPLSSARILYTWASTWRERSSNYSLLRRSLSMLSLCSLLTAAFAASLFRNCTGVAFVSHLLTSSSSGSVACAVQHGKQRIHCRHGNENDNKTTPTIPDTCKSEFKARS